MNGHILRHREGDPEWGPVTYRDLVFREVPIAPAKWVSVGMPTIPARFLDVAVYLYPDFSSAALGSDFGACGFLVGIESKHHNYWHVYAVSNYHAAVYNPNGAVCPIVRANIFDGNSVIFERGPEDWTFIQNGGDVAVVEIQVNRQMKMTWITPHNFAAESGENEFKAGEDVFMVGRFVDHDGGVTNRPAVRFGNVSVMPSHLPDIANSDEKISYALLDMHSRTGFSGSAVFAYTTAADDLNGIVQDSFVLRKPTLKLLGIHCGQFKEHLEIDESSDDEATKKAERRLVGMSGMTYALPAWQILKVLNHPRLVERRRLLDEQHRPKDKTKPEGQ